jgi:hypothetical protein
VATQAGAGAHRADSARLRAGLSYCRVITEREVLTCAVIPYRPVVGAVEAIYREGRVVGALLTSGARSQGRSCYQTCHGPHEGGVPHRQRSPLPCLWGPGLSVSLTRSPNSPATALWGGPRVQQPRFGVLSLPSRERHGARTTPNSLEREPAECSVARHQPAQYREQAELCCCIAIAISSGSKRPDPCIQHVTGVPECMREIQN